MQCRQSYLSILCEDYVYEQEKACLQDYPTFQSTINKPIQLNYKKIFDEKALNDSTKTDETDKSNFSKEAAPYIYEGSNPKPQLIFVIPNHHLRPKSFSE